jgi:hypothetical protein
MKLLSYVKLLQAIEELTCKCETMDEIGVKKQPVTTND